MSSHILSFSFFFEGGLGGGIDADQEFAFCVGAQLLSSSLHPSAAKSVTKVAKGKGVSHYVSR